jgi:putative spermidine/putrescine transport system permease protein/spermidine/putrescine transport system permease protein
MNLNRNAFAILAGVTALVFCVLYGPIFVPIVLSFYQMRQGQIDWSQPGFDSYRRLAQNEGILEALQNTLAVGAMSVGIALTFGTLLALYCQSGRSKGRDALQFIAFLPFLMPPIITGLSLLIFFREIDFDRSLATIVIGHSVFLLALAYRTILVRLQSIGLRQIEASYDLGADAWQTFRFVLMPNLKGALIGAGILAFALSFDETMITILVTGTQNTLPIRLWAMMRLGFTPDINALVAMILALTAALVLLAARQLAPKELMMDGD